MKSKPRWLPILLFGIVLLLASMIPACSQPQEIPPQNWTVADETEFLAKCEEANITFDRYERDDTIVYFHHRMIGDIKVELDFINYQFDRDTRQFKAKYSHWRDDLPETPPAIIISKEQAETIANGTNARLLYISPESCMFRFTPSNPCWAVFQYNELGWNMDIIVVDAITGEIIGHGVPTE